MIWKILKKSKLKSEKIRKIWKKCKSNSEKIWQLWKKGRYIVKRYRKYGRTVGLVANRYGTCG
jgi:hypothetical protein